MREIFKQFQRFDQTSSISFPFSNFHLCIIPFRSHCIWMAGEKQKWTSKRKCNRKENGCRILFITSKIEDKNNETEISTEQNMRVDLLGLHHSIHIAMVVSSFVCISCWKRFIAFWNCNFCTECLGTGYPLLTSNIIHSNIEIWNSAEKLW